MWCGKYVAELEPRLRTEPPTPLPAVATCLLSKKSTSK